jgi:hypothetical protein
MKYDFMRSHAEKGVRFIYSRSFSEVNGPDPCCFSFCFEIGDYADKSNVNPWIVNSISAFSSEFVTRKTNDVLKNIQPEKSAPEDKDKNP